LLYVLAAGQRPFPGPTSTALLAQILHEPPAPLASSAPEVSAEFARVVHKLLEKSPAARFQTAREVHAGLTNLLRELALGRALPAVVVGKRAAAVLPFKLLTPNPEDEYLSVALADALIRELGATGEVLVRPVSTVMRYLKQHADPLLAARELNVQLIVDGSIQKSGPRLRVHVQAWNVADDSTLLSVKHDAEMDGLFALQDKMAGGVVRALGAKKTPSTTTSLEPPTKNPRAYELYLRASERILHVNRWDTVTAIQMLDTATRLDSMFADAWAKLAEAHVMLAVVFEPGPKWIRHAERAVRRALKIDPENAEAQTARARLLWTPAKGFQHRVALRALDRALELDPGRHEARSWRSGILFHVGMHEEAREGLLASLAANPDDTFTLDWLGQTALYRREYNEAAEYLARALTVEPSNLWANLFYPMVSIYSGKDDEAEERIRAAEQYVPGDGMLTSFEALLWARRGDRRRAQQAIQRTLRNKKSLLHTHHSHHNLAAAYAVLGRPAEAVKHLERAAKTGLPNCPLFRDDPHFASLHGEPAYESLLRKLGREWESYRREFGSEP